MKPKTTTSGSVLGGDPPAPSEAPTIILGEPEHSDGPPGAAQDGEPLAVAVGSVVGARFRLIELLGEGGMSRVFKALDLERTGTLAGDAYVAVKVLTRPFTEDEAAFSTVQEEFHRLQRLSHPNIVQLFSCDREASTIFVSMEYLVGRSLFAKLHEPATGSGAQPAIDREEARRIITAVAGALDHAHQHLIVHGDLKPGNIILTDAGDIKVIDFGVEHWIGRPKTALERREAAQRQPGAAVTPRYASPQLMARHRPEIKDDIYALACLAYELATGVHPFDDGSGSSTVKFPPPMRTGLTRPEYTAITRALQLERRDRTPTVRQFIEEFSIPERPRFWKTPAAGVAAGVAVLFCVIVGWYLHRTHETDLLPAQPAGSTTANTAPPSASTATPASAKAGSVIRDCATCPQMTVLPTGTFEQGSASRPGASVYEQPQHAVTFAHPIAMANRDVTVGDFREYIAATGRNMQGCEVYDGEWRRKPKASWKDPGFAQTDVHPVTCTSWEDATAYAQWLSGKTGHRYRLPSASEWEYAARAGSEAAVPWGSDPIAACANANVADQSAARRYPGWEVFACDDGYANTAPVSSFKANAFGLDDMLGNVFQWTEDCWHPDYSGAPGDGSARMDGDCTQHELRGGSWFSSPNYVRPAYRNHFAAGLRTSSVGFRLVREIGP